MKSVEDFDNMVEKKFESIQQEMDEKARKKREVNESIADAIIELMSLSMNDFSEYGSKEITFKESVLGDYNISKGEKSNININHDGITIRLYYGMDKSNRLPEEYDEHLLNKLLIPYYIKVTFAETRDYGTECLTAIYDRAKRLREQSQQIPKERTL
jgi:hypothetical protein